GSCGRPWRRAGLAGLHRGSPGDAPEPAAGMVPRARRARFPPARWLHAARPEGSRTLRAAHPPPDASPPYALPQAAYRRRRGHRELVRVDGGLGGVGACGGGARDEYSGLVLLEGPAFGVLGAVVGAEGGGWVGGAGPPAGVV